MLTNILTHSELYTHLCTHYAYTHLCWLLGMHTHSLTHVHEHSHASMCVYMKKAQGSSQFYLQVPPSYSPFFSWRCAISRHGYLDQKPWFCVFLVPSTSSCPGSLFPWCLSLLLAPGPQYTHCSPYLALSSAAGRDLADYQQLWTETSRRRSLLLSATSHIPLPNDLSML